MARIRMAEAQATTLGDLVSDAFETLEALGAEFRDMYDNAPESLQQTSVNQTRDETASTLENLSAPDVPEALAKIGTTWQSWQSGSKRRGLSRANQAAEACAKLEHAMEMLEALQNNSTSEQLKSDADNLNTELDSAKSEAEGCEFPGMFG